jgi:hypothetical protein
MPQLFTARVRRFHTIPSFKEVTVLKEAGFGQKKSGFLGSSLPIKPDFNALPAF